MKFNLTATGSFYTLEQKTRLETLGFRFTDYPEYASNPFCLDCKQPVEIEINTLEELIEFSKQWGELIITEDGIEIYNDYRE